jgi:hypothetical protein
MFVKRAVIKRLDYEVAAMLRKIAIVVGSVLLGVCCGSAVGWLVGRTIYFFVVELPNRNLAPEQYSTATCGLNLSIGMLTFCVLIPAGVVLGSVFGFGFGMKQTYEE